LRLKSIYLFAQEHKMKTNTNPYLQNPTPNITRHLEHGLDYPPDWRNRVVQQYLSGLAAEHDCQSQKLAKVMAAEPDEDVIDLLVFHLNGPAVFGPCIDYALRCVRANAQSRVASTIKAMILADFSPEEIAIELGTETQNIHLFEYLVFDTRRYLNRRTWLRGICYPEETEVATPEVLTELRFLQIAFSRGKAGVREDILCKPQPNLARTAHPAPLGRIAKKAVQRASEFYQERDLRVAPDEMDVKMLSLLGHLGENLEHPIFASEVESQPVSKASPISWEKILSIDWDKQISQAAQVVNFFHARYRSMLRAKLGMAVAETELAALDNADASLPNGFGQGGSINWKEVVQALDALGFGADLASAEEES
jgi:hypothetical protein